MPVPEDAKSDVPDSEAEEPETGSAEEAETGSAEEPETGSAEEAAGAEQELEPLNVYALLGVTIAQLSAAAWQKMGLQPDPFTNAIHRDVEQARVAIDCIGLLADKLLPQLHGQEARDVRSMLTDLRLNFVRQCEGESPQE